MGCGQSKEPRETQPEAGTIAAGPVGKAAAPNTKPCCGDSACGAVAPSKAVPVSAEPAPRKFNTFPQPVEPAPSKFNTFPRPAEPECGAPSEAETARLQALLNCKQLDTPDERRFDAITCLVKELLQVPMCLVSFIDSDRLWFKSVAGLEVRRGDRLHSFCDAITKNERPTMMVVPNTMEDVRFQGSQFVAGPPYIRFYAGAPLISSDGYTLGTLTVMDLKPRTFPVGGLNIICNFAELVVRESERDLAFAGRLAASQRPARAPSASQEAVVLIDVAQPNWPMLYVNDQWCNATGMDETACLDSEGLWHSFHASGQHALEQAGASIAARSPFAVAMAVRDSSKLTIEFRPANNDQISAAAPRIGIPNFAEIVDSSAEDGMNQLYFGVVQASELAKRGVAGQSVLEAHNSSEQTTSLNSVGSTNSSELSFASRSTFDLERPETLQDLALGPLVGTGAFGRVYRGSWQSSSVAVKVITTWSDPHSDEPTAPLIEALLSKRLSHPNVVQTLEHALKTVGKGASTDDESEEEREDLDACSEVAGVVESQTWILQEFCDHGTLGDGIARGWLRSERVKGAPANLAAVLATAQEIAAALCYCHEQGVLHGDLTAGNVMLMGQPAAGPGQRDFTAKVGDFGLARILEAGESQLVTTTCGTITYMPLERVQENVLTKATDVYSFGVLCWEMLLGQRAWAGRQPVQILYARTTGKEKLEVPEDVACPPAFRELITKCLDEDYKQRPTFEDIGITLKACLEAVTAAQ